MTTLLVGVDPGESSTRAVKFAVERAKLLQADILVVHVINWSAFSFTTPTDNEERHKQREQEIQHAENDIVGPMMKLIEEGGVKGTSAVQHGHPVRILIELAHSQNVDQIVLGRTGESPIHDRIFGSVAGRVAQSSSVPVTVVP